MRPDLAKCTTERERRGRGYAACYKLKFGGTVKIHPDAEHDYPAEFGGFKSSARRRHYEHKEFSDVLNPLRGNLRRNLGRRWDDVFSEFCQVLDRRSLSGYHIWTHLKQEVTLHTFMLEGKVCEKNVSYPYRPKMYGGGIVEVGGFYVHPETGLLEYKEPDRSWWLSRKKDEQIRIPVPGAGYYEQWYYMQFDGLWFRCLELSSPDRVTGEGGAYRRHSANRKEIAWIRAELAKHES